MDPQLNTEREVTGILMRINVMLNDILGLLSIQTMTHPGQWEEKPTRGFGYRIQAWNIVYSIWRVGLPPAVQPGRDFSEGPQVDLCAYVVVRSTREIQR